MKFIIYYENIHWCGGKLTVVVNANSVDEAIEKASEHMDECQRDLFAGEIEYAFEEDPEFDDSAISAINSVEILNEKHEAWEFYKDPGQACFYPEID